MTLDEYFEQVVEEFQNQYASKDDNSKLHELKMDRCTYQTLWSTDNGNLVLRLFNGDYGSVHVLLAYYDRVNGLKVEAAAMDDL